MEAQVFEHLRVTSAGAEVELGGTKQQTVLLALLIANGAAVSTDDLIRLVWGSSPPSKPNVTLRSYISHLRRVLEPGRGPGDRAQLLVTRAPGYAIDPEHIHVDSHAFTEAAGAALALPAEAPASDLLAATAAAFRHWPDDGAMPPDTALRVLGDFPHEVSRLTELHLMVCILHYRAALADGRSDETLASLEQASAQHPSSEQLVALRMTGLYQAGRPADAIAAFQDARSALLDDFGLDPSPLLTDLERRILTNDPSLQNTERPSPIASPPAAAETSAPTGRRRAFDQVLDSLPGPTRLAPGSAIIGPPGIGKSTLLHAVADAASERGMVSLWGRCTDTASATTLRPWTSVLRDLLERTKPERITEVFGPQAAELVAVVPELAAVLDLPATSPQTSQDLGDAIARTLQRWAAQQPLLVCLEDLHWADPESLVVAKHLLDTVAHPTDGTSPDISLVVTWRDTDVAVEAKLARVPRTQHLADIARAVGPCRVQLDGLDSDDVANIVRTVVGVEPEAAEVERLTEHTGGNPLFVTELLREGRGQSFEPTDTIRDVVLRRLDDLPQAAVDVLTAASLCHPAIDEAILPELTGTTEAELAAAVEGAMAARLIEESPSQIGHYRFSHDLLAETLAGEIRERRRAELHATIGRLLEKHKAPVADIAHHYLLGATAGSSIGAARFAQRAALEAEHLADFEGAVRWLDDGLAALDLGPDAPALRIDMLIDRAQTLKFLSAHIESHEASTRAFELAVEAGEVDLAAVAAMVYVGMARIDQSRRNAEWLAYWSPPDESVAILERALELMPQRHRWRSALLLALSNQMFGAHHDQDRADDLARVGLALLRDDDQPRAFAEGLVSMAHAHTRTLPADERRAMLEESVELARSIDYPKVELRARKALITMALDDRNLQAARDHVAESLRVSAQTDDPYVRMQAASMEIGIELLTGQHDRAGQRIAAAFADYATYGDAATDVFGMQYFTLARHQGHFDMIIAAVAQKLEGYTGPAYGAPLAALQARAGRFDDALATIQRFTDTEITWGGEGVLQFMTPAYFADAVADLSIERPEVLVNARPLIEALAPANGRMLSLVGGADHPSIGAVYRARLLTALGDTDAAAALFDGAIDHLAAIEARTSLLWARLAVAENRAAAGDHDATGLVEPLRLEADALGMAWAIEWQLRRVQQRLNTVH